jgi:branched-chain amino acid transport system ATP-binding protein
MLGRHQHINYGVWSALWYAGRAKREEIRNRAAVEDIIDFLEIEQYRKYPVGLLPYGIQKRMELGRALALEPKLLLLDEPVAGMNLEETEDMARFILDIRDELAIPMILVEHDMGLVMDLADRVLVLDFGKPIAIGAPDAVQRDPNVIRAYLGEDHAVADQATLQSELATPSGGDE